MKRNDIVNIRVVKQGAPIINDGFISRIGKGIVLLDIDLKSKYCDVATYYLGSDGYCGVWIKAPERALNLKNGVDRRECTQIEFTDFKGWRIVAHSIGRYSLAICLTKDIK